MKTRMHILELGFQDWTCLFSGMFELSIHLDAQNRTELEP